MRVIILLVLVGCFSTSQTRISPGRYTVRVNGNAYVSVGQAKERLHARAQELCTADGYESYQIMDASAESDGKPEAFAVIECKGISPGAAESPATMPDRSSPPPASSAPDTHGK